MTIYKITNIKNNKIYIGLTIQSAHNRFSSHISEAKRKVDKSYLNNAIRKYGKDNFKLEIIDSANSIEELKQKEIFYISLFGSRDRKVGYNLSEGGDGTPGVLKSKETREKIRQKALGRKQSLETRLKQSIRLKSGNYNFEKGTKNLLEYNKKTSKKVIKFDLNMNELEEYESITNTSKINEIDRTGLISYLKSNKFEKRIPYKGFLYKIKSLP